MENQHKMIKGYRDLNQEEIDMMNNLKNLANHVGDTLDLMSNNTQYDQRWVSIAKTDLQKGFMAAIRAVAKPESF